MTFRAFLEHMGFALALALLSAAAVRAMVAWPILDHPNHRSAHAHPTPRGGGVGVVLAFLVAGVRLTGFRSPTQWNGPGRSTRCRRLREFHDHGPIL